jgi:hypothetical protein
MTMNKPARQADAGQETAGGPPQKNNPAEAGPCLKR